MSRHRLPALVLVAALLGSLAACTAAPPEPGPTASAFTDALSRGDAAGLGATTDDPTAAAAVLTAARDSLQPVAITASVRQVLDSGDTATAVFDATWTLPHDRTWTYSGQLPLARTESGWTVRWSPADLHPQLGANQTLALHVDAAPTATVLDRTGTPVLEPTTLVRVTLEATKAGDVSGVATALAAALSPIDPSITAQSILADVTPEPDRAYLVARLRETDYQAVKAAIYDLPGVTFPTEQELLAPDRSLAPTLVSQVRDAVSDELDGTAGWQLVTVGPTGADVAVLDEQPVQVAPSLSLTLDARVQSAAQSAVDAVADKQAVVVALQPSTGDVLAVAQNAAADAQGPIALNGLYPPGSTFKIVTASAALQEGVATVDTPLPCPGTTVIGPRRIPNYDSFDLGTVPLSTAFAKSCNTTFAQLATALPADGLTTAAAQLGLGSDYAIEGMTTVTGTVPPAADEVERAEDGFGQGEVTVTPFGMALAAAAVAHGSTPVPVLVTGGSATRVTDAPTAIPSDALAGVRTMMRDVVTSGTATAVAGSGTVLGKTGEAQFGDGTRSHAWFVGYRGDLAFATLIVDGGSSSNAVRTTRAFLDGVPSDYGR